MERVEYEDRVMLRCSGSEDDRSTQRRTSSILEALENEAGCVEVGEWVGEGDDVFMEVYWDQRHGIGRRGEGFVPKSYPIPAR